MPSECVVAAACIELLADLSADLPANPVATTTATRLQRHPRRCKLVAIGSLVSQTVAVKWSGEWVRAARGTGRRLLRDLHRRRR